MYLHATIFSFVLILAFSVTSHANTVRFARNETAHIVITDNERASKRVLDYLTKYLADTTHRDTSVITRLSDVPADAPAVILACDPSKSPLPINVPTQSGESYAIKTGKSDDRSMVVCVANTDKGIKRAVYNLVLESRQQKDALIIPDLDIEKSPWIPSREWTLCPWEPEFVRGYFYNPQADRRLDIYRYSRKRLGNYVDMFDWFGFSGCQLMETCYTYNILGSVEAAHEWQKLMAECVRSRDLDVTLWAWTACFEGFGWYDPDVTYTPAEGNTAFEDPKVRKAFLKYYSYYSELAPLVDRFIAHFYDPGMLEDQSDVFAYTHLLEDMLKKRNPSIKMGIDCWAATPQFLIDLAENGFEDYLLLPVTFPEAFPGDSREKLHEKAKELGLDLGIWGWYTAEYETDQIASMYVNAQVLKDVYTDMKDGALAIKPVEYWSEMEAHHINNIYSMYVSSQLLWDPTRNPHELLSEITESIWGPKNGPEVYKALRLIEDVRSGPTWETYWWTRPTHRVGTEDAADDLRRAEECMKTLTAMTIDQDFVVKVPLPQPPEVLIDLMLPHIEQIRVYSQFRLDVENIRKMADAGATKNELKNAVEEAWKPIPEFRTWIGTFGTKETREQLKTIVILEKELGIKVEAPELLREAQKLRILDMIRTSQRLRTTRLTVSRNEVNSQYFWPDKIYQARFDELIGEGLLEEVSPGRFSLSDWHYWSASH